MRTSVVLHRKKDSTQDKSHTHRPKGCLWRAQQPAPRNALVSMQTSIVLTRH